MKKIWLFLLSLALIIISISFFYLSGLNNKHKGLAEPRPRIEDYVKSLNITNKNEIIGTQKYIESLENIISDNAATSSSVNLILSARCLSYTIGVEKATNRIKEIETIILDTPEKQKSYLFADSGLDIPNPTTNNPDILCNF